MPERFSAPFASLALLLQDFVQFSEGRIVIALFLVVLGAAAEAIGLLLLVPFFSLIGNLQAPQGWAEIIAARLLTVFPAQSDLSKLGMLIVFFIVLMVARAFVITARDVILAELGLGFTQHVRSRITRKLSAAPWDVIARLRHSRLTQLISTELHQVESAIYLVLRDGASLFLLIAQIGVAFVIAPVMTALVGGIVVFSAACFFPMFWRARRLGNAITESQLSLMDNVTQFLGALKLAISHNLQDGFSQEFDRMLGLVKVKQLDFVRQQTLTRVAGSTVAGIIGAIAVYVAVGIFDISASVLIIALLIFSRMYGPLVQLQLDVQQLAHVMPSYEKICELESDLAGSQRARLTAAKDLSIPQGPIEFRKVSFTHRVSDKPEDGVAGVKDLDLAIQPGSIVGIVGPSGSGKTTFADLLVGLYAPQTGQITVGGHPLCGISISAWRQSISYVAQDPFLFHDTIRQNFLWANPTTDEAAIWHALYTADADQLVRQAAHGLDTVVGERGNLLSGGERQRVCLARALLRSPALIVLDEATSAIDIEGERIIFDRILKLRPRPSIVIVTHRPETLRYCELIYSFRRGGFNRTAELVDLKEARILALTES